MPGGAALARPTVSGLTGYIRRPGKRSATRQTGGATGMRVLQIRLLDCHFLLRQKRLSRVISAYIALPVNRLRYAGMAQERTGAASRRRPCTPAPASKIAAARSFDLSPAGFGSGRGSVRAKHGPQPASMRAAPAFRERLSDFEAVSTGSFSGEYINDRLDDP